MLSGATDVERSPASTTRLLINLFPTSPSERGTRSEAGRKRASEKRTRREAKGTGRSRGGGPQRGSEREWREGGRGRSGNPGIGREAVEGDGRNKKLLARRQVFLSFFPLLPLSLPQRLTVDLLILPLLRAAQASCQERRAAPT